MHVRTLLHELVQAYGAPDFAYVLVLVMNGSATLTSWVLMNKVAVSSVLSMSTFACSEPLTISYAKKVKCCEDWH